jgi:Spy/CpxP family protein refolding chaperone
MEVHMSRALQCGVVAASIGIAGILPGCGGLDLSGITGSTSLSDALNQLSQQVAADPTLSQLTVSDVVQGFEQYAQQFQGPGGSPALTADQQAQLESLQSQLDSGAITLADFSQQVQALIGDVAPGRAFAGRGMMGGPFGGDPESQLADDLQLTDEQRTQAADIAKRLHDDISALRVAAEDQIKALLTADQLAQLEAMPSQRARMGHGRPGHMGPPGEGVGLGGLFGLTKQLQLTEDQQTAIEKIRTDLRTAVAARHQQARDEFRAILTADQLALLDQLEAEHQPAQ